MASQPQPRSCTICTHIKKHNGELICTSQKGQGPFTLYNTTAAEICFDYMPYKNKNYEDDIQGAEISQNLALRYMLAGKSRFTIVSGKTGQHFTYSLKKVESNQKKDKYLYMLSVFGRDTIYAGVLWFDENTGKYEFSKGKKGNLAFTDVRIVSLLYVLNNLQMERRINVKIFHTGYCGRCGKRLTTPESILTGLGPECSKKCGVPRIKVQRMPI